MANPYRGEITAVIGGETRTLCLTLGALAELETRFEQPDLLALAERFESGRLKSSDLIAVIGAGLRGGGAEVCDAEVAAIAFDGGAATAVRIVSDLLHATFGAN